LKCEIDFINLTLMAIESKMVEIFIFTIWAMYFESFFPLDDTIDMKLMFALCTSISLSLKANRALILRFDFSFSWGPL